MKTKKSLLVMLVALVTLIATACGNNNANDNASPSASASAPSASESASPSESPAATTKTIKDGLDREVEIPANPQKIVALSNLGELLSLGVKPAGTIDYYLNKFEKNRLEGVVSVGADQADNEKVLALSPDLIIIPGYFEPEVLDGLQKIAPTVATKWGLTPTEHLDEIAGWLGKETEAQAWKDQYTAKAAEVKEKLKPFNVEGEKAVVIQFWSKAIYQHAPNVFAPVFDVGFVPTDAEKALTATAAITEEAVVDYVADADRVFILVDGQADKDVYAKLKDTAWKNIPAVKNDKVYLVNSATWNDFSTAAMEWMLADLPTLITK